MASSQGPAPHTLRVPVSAENDVDEISYDAAVEQLKREIMNVLLGWDSSCGDCNQNN